MPKVNDKRKATENAYNIIIDNALYWRTFYEQPGERGVNYRAFDTLVAELQVNRERALAKIDKAQRGE